MKTMKLAPLLATLAIAGWATAPALDASRLPATPAHFKEGGQPAAAPEEARPQGPWWKAFADPVMTMQPIASDLSNSVNAAFSSSISSELRALSACGRLRRTSPTLPCVSTRMLEKDKDASVNDAGDAQTVVASLEALIARRTAPSTDSARQRRG